MSSSGIDFIIERKFVTEGASWGSRICKRCPVRLISTRYAADSCLERCVLLRIRYAVAIAVLTPTLVTWMSAVVIGRSRRRIDRCPSCKSNRVRPSWPTIVDKFFSITSITAFRCEACLRRFYGRKSLAYRS